MQTCACVTVSGQCLDCWFICVGFHGLVAGLDLVCGDPWGIVCLRGFEAGQIRMAILLMWSSGYHHEFHHHQLIWGGFRVLLDSYCSRLAADLAFVVCLCSFRCSRSKRVVVPGRWVKGWRFGFWYINGQIVLEDNVLVFNWSFGLLINLELVKLWYVFGWYQILDPSDF